MLIQFLALTCLLQVSLAQGVADPTRGPGCSGLQTAGSEMSLSVRNPTNQPVAIYLLDANCQSVFYNNIQPGETIRLSAWLNSAWYASSPGGLVDRFRPLSLANTDWSIGSPQGVAIAAASSTLPPSVTSSSSTTRPTPTACSPNDRSGPETPITIRNSFTRPLSIFWVDPSCQAVFLASLQPNQALSQSSWANHVFIAMADTTAILDTFRVGSGTTWVIDGRSAASTGMPPLPTINSIPSSTLPVSSATIAPTVFPTNVANGNSSINSSSGTSSSWWIIIVVAGVLVLVLLIAMLSYWIVKKVLWNRGLGTFKSNPGMDDIEGGNGDSKTLNDQADFQEIKPVINYNVTSDNETGSYMSSVVTSQQQPVNQYPIPTSNYHVQNESRQPNYTQSNASQEIAGHQKQLPLLIPQSDTMRRTSLESVSSIGSISDMEEPEETLPGITPPQNTDILAKRDSRVSNSSDEDEVPLRRPSIRDATVANKLPTIQVPRPQNRFYETPSLDDLNLESSDPAMVDSENQWRPPSPDSNLSTPSDVCQDTHDWDYEVEQKSVRVSQFTDAYDSDYTEASPTEEKAPFALPASAQVVGKPARQRLRSLSLSLDVPRSTPLFGYDGNNKKNSLHRVPQTVIE